MTAKQAKQLMTTMKSARDVFSKMTLTQKNNLEKSWDVEHAYYSSTLEGSNIDRKEFEKIGKKIK